MSGLESDIEVGSVAEGGENRFVHRLPKPVKHPNLTLKRGLSGTNSELAKWCKEALENDLAKPIEPRSLVIELLDERGDPVASWIIGNAYPVKWSVGSFDAMKDDLAIESIELAYTTLQRIP